MSDTPDQTKVSTHLVEVGINKKRSGSNSMINIFNYVIVFTDRPRMATDFYTLQQHHCGQGIPIGQKE